MTALFIGIAVIAVPNVVFALILWWMNAATDARLTLRGMRYVSFMLALVVAVAGVSVWGFAEWLAVDGM